MIITESTLRRVVREVLREELRDAFFRTVTLERDGLPGEPEVVRETREVNILDFIMEYLPQVQGTLAGTRDQAAEARDEACAANAAAQRAARSSEAAAQVLSLTGDHLRKLVGFVDTLDALPAQAKLPPAPKELDK